MKRIALVLLASAAALAANSARADHVDVRASINLRAPAVVTPVQYGYGYGYGYGQDYSNGYWRDVSTRVLVPGHWTRSYDYYGRSFNQWTPAHYEFQTRRVWVNGWEGRRDWQDHERREQWEHERREREEHERREHEEHERREHGYDRDGGR